MLGWFAMAHPALNAQYTYAGEAESPDGKALRHRREERRRLRGAALHRSADAPAADGHLPGAAAAHDDGADGARRRGAGGAAAASTAAQPRQMTDEERKKMRRPKRRSRSRRCRSSRRRWWTTRSTSTTGARRTASSSRSRCAARWRHDDRGVDRQQGQGQPEDRPEEVREAEGSGSDVIDTAALRAWPLALVLRCCARAPLRRGRRPPDRHAADRRPRSERRGDSRRDGQSSRAPRRRREASSCRRRDVRRRRESPSRTDLPPGRYAVERRAFPDSRRAR